MDQHGTRNVVSIGLCSGRGVAVVVAFQIERTRTGRVGQREVTFV